MTVPESYVVFVIRTHQLDDRPLEPDEVTAKLGVAPDRVWRRGDPRPEPTGWHLAPYQGYGWEIRSKLAGGSIPDQVADLAKLLHPRREIIRSYAPDFDVAMECVVWLTPQSGPALLFSAETIALIADLRCAFGIDYQVMNE